MKTSTRRILPFAVLAALVVVSAALGGACSSSKQGESSELVATVSEAVIDQQLMTPSNEPTIAVNPTNPANIAIASGNLIQVSTNGGQTFASAQFTSFPPNIIFGNGDSSLTFDSTGRLFWAVLGTTPLPADAAPTCCDIFVEQVNPTTGQPMNGVPAVDITPNGPNLPTDTSDKEWMAADRFPGSPCKDNVYVGFAGFGGMRFTRSTNAGVNWSTPLTVSDEPADNSIRMIHLAVGADGGVYIAYHSAIPGDAGENSAGTSGRIIVKRSDDCGQTFPTANKWNAFASGSADLTINGQYQCNSINDAGVCLSGTPNVPRRYFRNENLMIGSFQPFLMPDPTNAQRLIVLAGDDPTNGNPDGGIDTANVYVVQSTNQGKGANPGNVTWTTPTQVDNGNGALQLMPTGAIDLNSPCVAVSYYDDRNFLGGPYNSSGDTFLDLYVRGSSNGGVSWGAETKLNDVRFDPDQNAFDYAPPKPPAPANYVPTRRIGEYNGIAVAHGVAHAVFTGNDTTVTDGGQRIIYDNLRVCTDPTLPPPGGNIIAARQSTAITAVFSVGSDGALYRRWYSTSTGTWQGPTAISGVSFAPPGAPLAVGQVPGVNELDVFVVDNNGTVQRAFEQNDGAWQVAPPLSGTGFAVAGAHIATGIQSGVQLDVLVVDKNGTLQGFGKQALGPWSANLPLANNFAPSGAGLATANHPGANQFDVFAIGTNGSVVGTWALGMSPFAVPISVTAAGVASAGAPLATGMQGTTQLDVFYSGVTDGAIHAIWYINNSPPFGPIALGASSFVPATANLSTVQVGTNLLGLFVVSNSGAPNLFWVVGQGTWNGPAPLTPVNGVAVAGASTVAASQGSNMIDSFTLGNLYLLEATYNISTNTWSNAVPLLP